MTTACGCTADTVTAYLKVVEDQQLWLEPLYNRQNRQLPVTDTAKIARNLAAGIHRQFSV